MNSLLKILKQDFTSFDFVPGETFHWSQETQTISYDEASNDPSQLLHELSHGILEHRQYQRDIELVAMEREAWTYTLTILGPKYSIPIVQSQIEEFLDSYRDWLHERSTCPTCKATGIETTKHQYECPACSTKWRVNDARIRQLKRRTIK